jgi:O-acetyl-ADP-ribose deacetylase (regulator of RNase III)
MITYLKGDATQHDDDGNAKIIAHICNDIGGWGRGFVLSLSKTYPVAEKWYRNWYQMQFDQYDNRRLIPFRLGRMQLVRVNNNIFVANMIAQHGIMIKDGVPPIRYAALEDCLAELYLHAKDLGASVHMPRIGCGLAGGHWSEVQSIVLHMLPDVDVYVYDFSSEDARTIPWKP